MAKTKTAKKTARKATGKAKVKTSAKKAPKAPAAKRRASQPATRTARHQTLPGMEQVRNRALDHICEEVSDVRADMNKRRQEEKELVNQAIRVMQESETTVYRFSGVELVLVPGDTKLRVRTLKDSDANAERQPTTADMVNGSGQDANEIAESLTEGEEPVSGHPAFDE